MLSVWPYSCTDMCVCFCITSAKRNIEEQKGIQEEKKWEILSSVQLMQAFAFTPKLAQVKNQLRMWRESFTGHQMHKKNKSKHDSGAWVAAYSFFSLRRQTFWALFISTCPIIQNCGMRDWHTEHTPSNGIWYLINWYNRYSHATDAYLEYVTMYTMVQKFPGAGSMMRPWQAFQTRLSSAYRYIHFSKN